MKKCIEISSTTYSRLEKIAEGFDTPEAVIVRLLDNAEGKVEIKPELKFYPTDENSFKAQLIENKEAEVVLYKVDGTREITRWKANRLSETSNLRGNLWSGFLRGWKTKGIKSAEFSILPKSINQPGDDTELRKSLALEFNLTFEEMESLHFEIDVNSSNDDLVYNHIVQFSDDCDSDILNKIDGLHENLWINVDNSVFQ
ncbi:MULTISPECIES: hypothetical protein [Pseudoalteromonas]|uniref:Uncharacterized protein n=1 Tax=Pseudoalteromonas arctica TaxID=394751 RepID=A0ABU9TLE7_9GAMM|nr:hypothetical protein [Pseudoalteromonas sp. NZS100]MBH0068980.1 hypothetical protein [Pseudoalteromonas sp. NZS100]